MKRLYLVFTAAIATAGCADMPSDPSASTPTAAAHTAGAQLQIAEATAGRRWRGFEDEILRLETRIPGLGGIARQADGRAVVFLQNLEQKDIALNELRAFAPSLHVDRAFRQQLATGDQVVFREGLFSFSQLVHWQGSALRALVAHPELVSVDADESRNRLRVTVEEGASSAAVEAAIRAAGVPIDAVVIDFGQRPVFLDLTARFRPTGGGIQIQNVTPGNCTLGFVVSTVGYYENGFLTASHCTPGSTGEPIYQNVLGANNQIGSVYLNPPWNVQNPACGGMPCTLADAMFVSSEWGLRRVAYTTYVGQNYGPGSLQVAGWWNHIARLPFYPYVGLKVDKVGRTTGWTRGTVESTCAALVVQGRVVLCSDGVTGSRVGGGDSGSPVFYRPVYPDPLYAAGILFAGTVPPPPGPGICENHCTYWFNAWFAIEGHLQRDFDPENHPANWWVNIEGPTCIQPWATGHWWTSTNVSQPGHQWWANGSPVGTDPNLYYSAGSTFTLEVQVWNAEGHGAQNSRQILVDPGCMDQ